MKNYNPMNNFNPMYGKTVISCISCLNKLKVPVDKGKISVTCPVCRKEFVYNPNSIFDTLRQITLSTTVWMKKSRRNQAIFFVAALAVLALVFFLLYGAGNKKNTDKSPGAVVYGITQQYHTLKSQTDLLPHI